MEVSIIGATGLVGSELTEILGHLPELTKIKAFTRSPLGRMPAKVENYIINFDQLENYESQLKADIFICCLGTTIKKAGSQDQFKKVDYEYPLNFAKIAERTGAKKLLIVTAMGADSNSTIFYNRTKGQLEDKVRELHISQVEIFRPSLILGDRKEKRLGEDLMKKVFHLTKGIFKGRLEKYRPIESSDIAKAMAIATLDFREGYYVYPSQKIQKIADQLKEKMNSAPL